MWHPPQHRSTSLAYEHLQGYVTELELTIDRLRKQSEFIQQEALDTLSRIQDFCTTTSGEDRSLVGAGIEARTSQFIKILQDLKEIPECAAADDRIVPFELRPLLEKVFRWNQRVQRADYMHLNLELQCEHLNWFPVRLQHILENLISNAIRFRDPDKGEMRLTITLSSSPEAYELRVVDNGIGISTDVLDEVEEFHRAIPNRPLGTGVGLSVVKMLVEQCGGSLTIDSSIGKGTSVVALLPRFDVGDGFS